MLRFSTELNAYISREFATQRSVGWLRPAGIDTPEAIQLWATIGYAVLLSADGRVWIERDWLGERAVHEANPQEAAGAFVKAAERHPLFYALVPARPATHHACAVCHGQGRMAFKDDKGHDSFIWCSECEGLGWFLPAAG